jgi:hypothetical protein
VSGDGSVVFNAASDQGLYQLGVPSGQ